MAWKNGPLPKDTYGWGGVVQAKDMPNPSQGFEFADFCGDTVKLVDGTILKAYEVGLYDNSLELPPGVKSRKGT